MNLPNAQKQQQVRVACHATPDKAAASSAADASPAVTTPGTAQTPATVGRPAAPTGASAAAAAAAAVKASPAPAAALRTPGLPPRINARKRSLSHPHTPGLQQQGEAAAAAAAAAAGSSGKAARKGFKAPAMTSPAPNRPAAIIPQQQRQRQEQPAATKKQRVQTAPVDRGLGLSDYFALAQAQQQQQQQDEGGVGGSSADSGMSPRLVWVADSLPANPKAAATFAFKAAAAPAARAADAGRPEQQQGSGADPAAAATPAAAAGPVNAPVPAAAAAVFGAGEARTALLAWGADPAKASAAWVSNHFKWIVWKLAAYDRKLMGPRSGSSSSGWCLSADVLVHQLQCRYTREVKEGQRSVLKKVGKSSHRTLNQQLCCLQPCRWAGIKHAICACLH
jgi:hypothetical protein